MKESEIQKLLELQFNMLGISSGKSKGWKQVWNCLEISTYRL